MNAEVNEKQSLLQITDLKERAERVLQMLNKELQMLELKNDIQKSWFQGGLGTPRVGRARVQGGGQGGGKPPPWARGGSKFSVIQYNN